MNYVYRPWDLERHLKLEMAHETNWKPESQWKKNRPLCGARCRDGHPCKAKAVLDKRDRPLNGRCRMHGGLSTGAKSEEGRERCRQAAKRGMFAYWQRKRESKR